MTALTKDTTANGAKDKSENTLHIVLSSADRTMASGLIALALENCTVLVCVGMAMPI